MKSFKLILLIPFLCGFVVELRDGKNFMGQRLLFENDRIILDEHSIKPESVWNIYITQQEKESFLLPDGSQYALQETLLFRLAADGVKKYPDADGIVLADLATHTLTKDGKQIFFYHFAGKILNEKKLEWGKRNIYFEKGRNKVTILFGRTIKENGESSFLTGSSIKIFEPPRDGEFFDTDKYISFNLPEVSVGSIVEFAYIDSIYKPEIPEFFFTSFYFQDYVPVMWSRFSVVIPIENPFLYKEYNFKEIIPDFESVIEDGLKMYLWEAFDIPPICEEYYMPHFAEVVPSVRGTTVKNWDLVFDILSEFQRQRMEPSPEIENLARKITKGARTDEERINRLYRFVQEEIEYISVKSSFSSGETGHPWQWTLSHKMGDCTDKSILLATMLNTLGYKAAPIVVMTNDEEYVDRTIPNIDGNHAIVKLEIDTTSFFLDPTSLTHTFPFFRADNYGVTYYCPIFRETGTIPVPPAEWNKLDIYISGKIHKDGKLYLKYISMPYGNMEAELRYWWATENPSDFEKIFENWANELFPGSKLKKWRLPYPLDFSRPFFEMFELEIPKFAKFAENLVIFCLPHLEKRFVFPEISTDERKYPIKYGYPILIQEKTTFEIPKNWIPKINQETRRMETKWGEFKYDVGFEKNKLKVEYTYKRDSLTVSPSEYNEYKNYLKTIREFAKNGFVFERKTK